MINYYCLTLNCSEQFHNYLNTDLVVQLTTLYCMAKQQHPVQINPCTLNKICYTVTHILAQHLLNIKGIEGDDLWCGLRMGRPLLVHYNNDTQIIEIQPPPNITPPFTASPLAPIPPPPPQYHRQFSSPK